MKDQNDKPKRKFIIIKNQIWEEFEDRCEFTNISLKEDSKVFLRKFRERYK